MNIYLCIASNQPKDLELIRKSSVYSIDGFQGGKVAMSVETLTNMVSNDNTNVLLVDVELPGTNLFSCIQKLQAQKPLQVVLICPGQDFEYAYAALKIQAADLLIRPFSVDQVSTVLQEAFHRLKSPSLYETEDASARREFCLNLSSLLKNNNVSISSINQIYHTNFRDGLFRVVTVAIDFPYYEKISELSRQLWHSIRNYIELNCVSHFFEILYTTVYNEIRLVFNYPSDFDSKLLKLLPNLYIYIENICIKSTDLNVFIGIGTAYPYINGLTHSLTESLDNIWVRMSAKYRKENIIASHDNRNLVLNSKSYAKISLLGEQLQKSIQTLNIESFSFYTDQFFSLPDDILCSSLAREIILNQIRYLRDTYRERINAISDANEFYHKTKMTLLSSRSFNEYHTRLKNCICPMLEQLKSTANTQQHNYAEKAIAYINHQYMNDISLSSAASEIGLSPNYLSRIFKEETGKTFSDFLLECRLTTAAMLLTKSTFSIKEICYAIGYTDQHYFSRIFMRRYNMTPTAFRKIHKSV